MGGLGEREGGKVGRGKSMRFFKLFLTDFVVILLEEEKR